MPRRADHTHSLHHADRNNQRRNRFRAGIKPVNWAFARDVSPKSYIGKHRFSNLLNIERRHAYENTQPLKELSSDYRKGECDPVVIRG